MYHIKKTQYHIQNNILEQYANLSSATIHEAMGRSGALDPKIKPLDRHMFAFGTALTVQCHEGDNIMLIKAISMAKPGDFIVVDMGSAEHMGPFGEVLAVECLTKKIAGLVLNCSIRDSNAIIDLGLPVFAAGISIRGTSKAVLGSVNHPIVCGGVYVRSGDLVVGDADGVVVVPYERAEEVLYAGLKRDRDEAVTMERLRNGESLFDLTNRQETFDRLGCREED
ncbi:MAG: 4-carboxy-4-hydroxy-2-oxoadipate aldolase/oxaloacetate decarboxylase [Clostridiaceae bacterium]|jgi:4-hydroxy-4-methyl-2-oxoglutarate aldolase|nr:4-carboxy-4-hydroxy-2-oxoadipate aldolase/oxaloacetate decarboxylase [Clostridiaceae bacterium]